MKCTHIYLSVHARTIDTMTHYILGQIALQHCIRTLLVFEIDRTDFVSGTV